MEFYKKLEKESIMKTKRKEKEKSEAARKENFNKNGTRLLYVFFLIIRIFCNYHCLEILKLVSR